MTEADRRYDAIVVGAGPNGLTAAISLASAGLATLVVEAQDTPGGAVRTEELTLPGFRHDVFSAVYPVGAGSPVFARLPLERHGLEWVHPRLPLAHVVDGDRAAVLARSVDETAAGLDALAPGDGERWRQFAASYLEAFGALRSVMLGAFPPVPGALRLLARRGPRGTLDFARLALMPATALAGDLFRSPGARGWLYGQAAHGDAPVDEAGSAIAGAWLALLGHAVGWPSPRGGARAIIDALLGHLAELGGAVQCRAPVRTVLVERGRTAGVVLASGETIAAPLVVADLTPRGLLDVAGAHLPPDYARGLSNYRYGPPTIKLDWALSGPIPWAAPQAREAGTVHVGGGGEEIARGAADVRAGRLPEQPLLLVGQQSVADPTRAPAGQHTAWAYTHPPRLDWARERERIAELIESRIEAYAPGFTSRILARHVLDPRDLEARNANLVGGDVGAGSYQLDQIVFRPVASLVPYRTPLPGLYLGSASTWPGGAVHGVPGAAAARVALVERRLRALPGLNGGRRRRARPGP
jgi:phytoene dehydrogenase-like protein